MQIALKSNGSYGLVISDTTIERITRRFAFAGSIDELLKKQITLTRLGTHLDAMERGYLQAYEGAENHYHLVGQVKEMKRMALQSVFEDLFGLQAFENLSKKEKRFLDLPSD
jgi:hypothetical protein